MLQLGATQVSRQPLVLLQDRPLKTLLARSAPPNRDSRTILPKALPLSGKRKEKVWKFTENGLGAIFASIEYVGRR